MTEIAPSCGNCKHWVCANYSHYVGYCRRVDPPFEHAWPFAAASECCEHHDPIENIKNVTS